MLFFFLSLSFFLWHFVLRACTCVRDCVRVCVFVHKRVRRAGVRVRADVSEFACGRARACVCVCVCVSVCFPYYSLVYVPTNSCPIQ